MNLNHAITDIKVENFILTQISLGTKTGTFSKCLEYRHDIYSKDIPPWHTI